MGAVATTQGIPMDDSEAIEAYKDIPYAVLEEDIASSIRADFFNELSIIKRYYSIYRQGASFSTEGSNGDYVPSAVRYKKIKSLIDKEARFMFSKTPDITVNINDNDETEDEKNDNTILNDFISKVLDKNNFGKKLVQAGKDCFIGKRVALVLNFNDETGIEVSFLNSLEFFYETQGTETLTKIVMFFTLVESSSNSDRRIKKKVYSMENGFCHVSEKIYDGAGTLVETVIESRATKFTYIPAVVIFNDGLTGETHGESEVEVETDYEKIYSKLANADIDSGRKSMNATRYVIDGSPESTEGLSTAPGAFWDIQSDQNGADTKTATVGMLEPSMNYSEALKTTLDRVDNSMHSQLDIPNINSEQLQGVITSGKTLKALYWGLTVRCDEKMLTWSPALRFMTKCIIEGSKLYPETVKYYSNDKIPDIEYDITVENNYPLPEDEVEEKTMDIAEVNALTMSKKAYMKKWRRLTDKQADAELEQILKEKQMFEDSYMNQMFNVSTNNSEKKKDKPVEEEEVLENEDL